MSRSTVHTEQSQLFLPESTKDGHYETWQNTEPEITAQPNPAATIPTSLGIEGSYVNLSERARYLAVSLRAIGLANQRLGFVDAAEVPPHRAEIWGRYARNTHRVIEGADKNRVYLQQDAKDNFWKATGLTAMHGAGLIDKHTRDAMGRTMWRDYSQKYGGVGQPVIKRRQKAIRSYAKQSAAN